MTLEEDEIIPLIFFHKNSNVSFIEYYVLLKHILHLDTFIMYFPPMLHLWHDVIDLEYLSSTFFPSHLILTKIKSCTALKVGKNRELF